MRTLMINWLIDWPTDPPTHWLKDLLASGWAKRCLFLHVQFLPPTPVPQKEKVIQKIWPDKFHINDSHTKIQDPCSAGLWLAVAQMQNFRTIKNQSQALYYTDPYRATVHNNKGFLISRASGHYPLRGWIKAQRQIDCLMLLRLGSWQ